MMWLVYVPAGIIGIFLIYVLFLFLCTAIINTKKEYDVDSRFYRGLLNGNTAVALPFLRIKVIVRGMEMLQEGQRYLFVCNHRSKFDPIVTWYIFRKWQIAFISKEENFHVPIFGRMIRKCCFMVIDREDPREAMKTINRAAELLKKDAVSVGVYPEGTRSMNGELLPFHNGVLKIAKKAGVPVVILAVDGTEEIKNNYPFHRSRVYLDVVDIIPFETVSSMGSGTLGGIVRDKLEERLEEIKNERKQ